MKKEPSFWPWILAVALLAAGLVAGAGFLFSRRVETFSEPPPGNRVDQAFRDLVRRVNEMEALWVEALRQEATRQVEGRFRDPLPSTFGVEQVSWLNPAVNDQARSHRRADGRQPALRPVLERFAKGEAGEWVFTEAEALKGNGRVDQPGKPPAWVHGNGRTAVVLLLDSTEAAAVVEADLAKRAKNFLPPDEPGFLEWSSPAKHVFLTSGEAHAEGRPDEILRHVSIFGDWTLRRHYPTRTVTTYHMPTLAGTSALASLLLGGGITLAVRQRRAWLAASQRVSFINRVSHELRTPLTNLLLNTDLALDAAPADNERLRRRLGLIREETSRLARIVDNVLTFARIERGRMAAQTAPCDVARLARELLENFAPLFDRKGISCRLACEVPESLALDPDALSQILSNLLSNIEKYAGENAAAQVSATSDGSRLTLDVSDDGPGIPTGARQRIFLPFERAENGVAAGASGTGLGLAISRDLARHMGGELELLPSEKGAAFRLVVPCAERSRS